MDRSARARSKSNTRKTQPGKSPRGRPRKYPVEASKSPAEPPKRESSRARSRGRPSKKSIEEREAREAKEAKAAKAAKERAQRERSRSSSAPRVRVSSRPKRSPKKREETSDDDQPLLSKDAKKVLSDVIRSGSYEVRNNLNDLVRRSLSREVTTETSVRLSREAMSEKIRKSARITERVEKADNWRKEGVPSISETQSVSAVKNKIEFGGWLGALIQIVGFLLVIGGTLLGCTKEQCLLKPFHIPRNPRVYLNVESAIAVFSFFVLQTLLAALPIGRIVKTASGTATYRANGFLALILTGALVAGAWYLGYPVTLAYERFLSAATAAYILAWVLALALFIKGGRAPIPGLNPYGNSGNPIYDFFMGRELNPTLFSTINIKIVLLRFCVIGSILVDTLLLLKGYEVRKEVSPTLATLVALKSWYCLDTLWFEESFSSTFEAQYEGVGFMAIQGFLMYPFFSAILPRFVLTHRIEQSVYALTTSVAAFLVGYCIYRASNLQKAAFRRNPLDPTISHLETISTSRGKKLLVSGWWGKVKHPNYLGDIILSWATASTIGFTHALPYIVPLFTTIFLLHRAKRDDRRCHERYQSAWAEYSRRVPYSIVPRVF